MLGLSPIPLYLSYAVQEAKYATASLRGNAQATAELAYFQKVAPSITTPAQLLGNFKVLSVVLGAFGLQNRVNQTAVLRQLLSQDPADKTSLAQKLGDPKVLLFAKALSNWTPPPFSTPSGVSQIVSSFTTNTFEASVGSQTPGLANALSFTREASSLSSSTAVQADPSLLAVVVTSLGLPLTNFQELSFEQQSSLLKQKLNVADFQNPAKVRRDAEQYLVSQQTSGTSDAAPGSLAALFSDTSDASATSILDILGSNSSTSTTQADGSAGLVSLFA